MRIPPNNPMKEQTNDGGFTLVEFLVSFTIVMLMLTGTVQLIIHSLLVKRHAELNFRIVEYTSALCEHFKSLPYQSDELKEGFVSETVKDGGSQETFIRKWKIEDISSHLKEIEIEIASKKHSQKKIRLVLYVSRELGF